MTERALVGPRHRRGVGATDDGERAALRDFRGLPHRLVLVGDDGGVRFHDDSKATAPHAVREALA
ncbi:MAG: UDP-N-acetylmuramoylalanine/D-glutamate ligase [Actinomycetia bacterium]|nr:UDP-N-acetylmuramoylalanine/D-glutamate ligase [Actinomycetes bacterium]